MVQRQRLSCSELRRRVLRQREQVNLEFRAELFNALNQCFRSQMLSSPMGPELPASSRQR